MAGEALEALGHGDSIPDEWIAGAERYVGPIARTEAIELGQHADRGALGDATRYGDWLDYFRGSLASDPWRSVVGEHAAILAPGLCGAAWHGLVRTGHAARALRRVDTLARRDELAAGLAYWAAQYTTLPTAEATDTPQSTVAERLQHVAHPWLDDPTDVGFSGVTPRLVAAPPVPAIAVVTEGRPADEALAELVRATATAFQEMLVQERHRIWMLHAVTGPAAVELLAPDLSPDTTRLLIHHAGRAALATHSALGAPFEPRANVRAAPPE
jgi:hypothetical protein